VWLLSPRGTAFLAVRPDRWEGLRPLTAGWYAGDDPWTSIYGLPLRLAAAVHVHDVGLADALLAGLGLPPRGSAIVTVDSPGADERLSAAGVRAAVRAGRVRLSFHLYSQQDDVDLALQALTGRR